MKYQLVVQFSEASINDYDELIEIEDDFYKKLTSLHEVDGHDTGAGEVNIFIFTNSVDKCFEEVKSILQCKNLMGAARIAYREIKSNNYVILWPEGLEQFSLA